MIAYLNYILNIKLLPQLSNFIKHALHLCVHILLYSHVTKYKFFEELMRALNLYDRIYKLQRR